LFAKHSLLHNVNVNRHRSCSWHLGKIKPNKLGTVKANSVGNMLLSWGLTSKLAFFIIKNDKKTFSLERKQQLEADQICKPRAMNF
jgi:uncharacterized Zn-finger protein